VGANMALRDAAALREALVVVVPGRKDWTGALAANQREMIEQGLSQW